MKSPHSAARADRPDPEADVRSAAESAARPETAPGDNDIAIVGMAARLPGAPDIETYWRNLRDGVESIRRYSDDELLAEGESLENLRRSNYVRAGGPLDGMEMFDGEFFGFSPKESAIMDPQHRHFLECCWEALENAGHAPERFRGPIGVFGGCGMGSYLYFNLCSNRELVDSVGLFLLRHTGNDKDFLVTRVSHLFDLKGPSVNVQTACSTSLVAAHLACQSLLAGECDMALAGGVTIEIPHRRGYLYQEGEVLSPDGHCHAFDYRGQGTVFGSGVGVVVLRRLRDAIEDGDHIHAVIKGSAVNNDGAGKAGYLAPSVEGQAAAMAEAHAVAGVDAGSIDYVECHGTGTYLGDPIEIAALTLAFRQSTDATGFCRIGSVKTNIGHLDTAAGIASLIKAALALEHRQMPPSLNFEKPNPAIDFASSPFVVNSELTEWRRRGPSAPRRAAVNSLGVGGTNAHMVLEEAPEPGKSDAPGRAFQLLTMSARSRKSLDAYQKRLADHLRAHPDQELADVAYSLHAGRRAFDQRRILVARSREEAIELLEQNDPKRLFSGAVLDKGSVVFMFSGGGSQYPGMGLDLYRSEPVYRESVDRGLELFRGKTGIDLRALLFPAADRMQSAAAALEHPRVQLPAIFIVEMALAKLWTSWGIAPAALIGHSVGENAAACLAEVLSYEDALGLVILRGELVERVAEGAMLSVALSETEVQPLVGEFGLDLAIVNSPELCVVSGSVPGVEALEKRLLEREVEARRLKISVAGHSRMLDPILAEFGDFLRKLKLGPPKIPFVSNYTGTWIKPEEATDPQYWVRHLRHTVRFSAGLKTLLASPERIFLEVGPGRILSSLVRQQPDSKAGQPALSSLRHPDEAVPDDAYFLAVLGRLWASGVKVDSGRIWRGEHRLRVPLPTYAFQHQRYFIDAVKSEAHGPDLKNLKKLPKLDDWFYQAVWRAQGIDRATDDKQLTWLVFMDDAGLGERLIGHLQRRGDTVVTVRAGDAYYRRGDTDYILSPERGREGYDALVKDLIASGKAPNRIAHLWLVTREEIFRPGSSFFHRNMERGFYSLLFLAQALADENVPRPLHVSVISNGMQQVQREPLPYPEKAAVLGPVKVIPRELPGVTCSSIDIVLPRPRTAMSRLLGEADGTRGGSDGALDALERELLAAPVNAVVAYRGGERLVLAFERRIPESGAALASRVRQGGVYLITGGLGGLGTVIANDLAERAKAKLVLLGRSPLPERGEWDNWLRRHGSDDRVSRRIDQVRALEAKGAEVLVVGADVTDVEGMREAVALARTRFGAIHGVIHTAGVVHDGLVQLKTMADVEDVFSPKIHGTVVLDTVFEGMELDFMVLFSSVSTVVAPAGQVDYVAANAFLEAYARSRSAQNAARQTVAINWGIWNEVGMAAEALLGPEPVAVGTRGSRSGAGTARAGETEHDLETRMRHPLLHRRTKDRHGDTVLATRLDPGAHWVLDEHRTLKGHALLPGTGYLELARAALEEFGETGSFELRDLYFFRPLHVEDGHAREVRVKLKRTEEGYGFEVRGRRAVDGRIGWELHAQAEVRLAPASEAARIDAGQIDARCAGARAHEATDAIPSPQEQHLRLGARWRVLRRAAFGRGEAFARLELPEAFAPDLERYTLHPALMDIATGFAMRLIEGYDARNLWVPVSYGVVRFRAPLERSLYSWVRSRGENKSGRDIALFDVTLADASGRVLVEIEEFAIKKLVAEVDFAVASQPLPSEIDYDRPAGEGRQLTPAELQLQRNLQQGILPREGAEAFARILAGPARPSWVVTSLDLAQLVEQAAQAEAPAADGGTKFARPELDSEYVEPRDEIERVIVGFWRELLGVEKVGVRDSFFDLGGHSLIAVRLFAKIKKAFHVDYPISVLFEAPTIERCASMIREAIGAVSDSVESATGAASAAREAPRTRYLHLVPMHSGEGGPHRPFFLVAGMFGNVLNLRHLANLIGSDRPFYGLQARGLYGDSEPHETFEEMARDYLKELRTVQPRGPYYLGGFSGGGITAYEMAQQLREEGEEVALLAMLDSRLPVSPPITRLDRVRIHLQRLRRQGFGYVSGWARTRYRWELERLQRRFGAKEDVQQPYELHNEAIEAAFRAALPRYRVRPYPGTVTLFRPKLDRAYVLGPGRVLSSELEYVYHDNDWGRFVDRVEVHEISGTHDSMVLEPNVRVLAAKLRACLGKAEAAIASAPGGPGAEPGGPAAEPATRELAVVG
jgi:acyl transferase domain-containing protein/thioesterase domain-containing protein